MAGAIAGTLLMARYTSVSVPYHIGNGWGGGLVPFITSAAFAAASGSSAGAGAPSCADGRKGNMTERLMQATAASYVISPAALSTWRTAVTDQAAAIEAEPVTGRRRHR